MKTISLILLIFVALVSGRPQTGSDKQECFNGRWVKNASACALTCQNYPTIPFDCDRSKRVDRCECNGGYILPDLNSRSCIVRFECFPREQ